MVNTPMRLSVNEAAELVAIKRLKASRLRSRMAELSWVLVNITLSSEDFDSIVNRRLQMVKELDKLKSVEE